MLVAVADLGIFGSDFICNIAPRRTGLISHIVVMKKFHVCRKFDFAASRVCVNRLSEETDREKKIIVYGMIAQMITA